MDQQKNSNNINQKKHVDQSRDRKGADKDKIRPIPLAYFITFSCYGTHLHGHESESVDRSHNKYGTPYLLPDAKKQQRAQKNMIQNPYLLDKARAGIVLDSIINTSIHREWNLMAAHVRSNHVHVVIQALDHVEKIMSILKSYASRALNQAGFDDPDRRRWSRHGSTRYVWKVEELANAIQYVLHEQGEPMMVYKNKNVDVEVVFKTKENLESAPLQSRLR
jgi:REP element-mobilizing transposase RayT